jgi:hypothetical protein
MEPDVYLADPYAFIGNIPCMSVSHIWIWEGTLM